MRFSLLAEWQSPTRVRKFNYKMAWFERLIAHAAELMAAELFPWCCGRRLQRGTGWAGHLAERDPSTTNAVSPTREPRAFARLAGDSRLDRCSAEVAPGRAALDILGLRARALGVRQGHAA